MKTILLLGAGKSATVLIDYLLQNAAQEQWRLIIADVDLALAKSKIGNNDFAKAVRFDVSGVADRVQYIRAVDLVISLLPPALHILVAKDCIQYKKNLLTASYIDEAMLSLKKDIEQNNLLFLCEMGLDPGIDHMSAKKLIDEIQNAAGKITSLISHCGGLVAKESDDNPWHYKISWNPRNVVMAGKSGAVFQLNGEIKSLTYEELFAEKRYALTGEEEVLCWYPNRDSLKYKETYGLKNCPSFIRTTLRHPDFMWGWRNIIDLHLTDEIPAYDTNGKTLMQFFQEHMDKYGFNDWLQKKLQEQFDSAKNLLNDLMKLVDLEEANEGEPVENFMLIDEKGKLENIDIEELKTNAAASVATQMHEANLTLKQLFFLGMDDDTTLINKGFCSAADVLQAALEKQLALQRGDKDRVVMLHEIEYAQDNRKYQVKSILDITGEDKEHTAMAKTVGLPLGIAARLILNGTIQLKGLHIPIAKEIYGPVLEELAKHDIIFKEQTKTVS